MMIVTESVLTESRSARDGQLVSTSHEQAEDILSKAKALLFFAMHQGNKIATTEQVAEFYESSVATVQQVVKRHKDEFEQDGLKVLKGKALKEVTDILSVSLGTPHLTAWTPRSVLRLGMLLRDSDVAQAVRTALLDEIEASAGKSTRIKELELELAIAQANATTTTNQFKLVEKTEQLAAFHGVPTALTLLGRSDEVVEIDKPTIEVIDEKHKAYFKGQTLKQVAEYVNKRYGIRFKNGGEVKKILQQRNKDSLIAHVPRAVVSEYIPTEHLQEAYKALTSGERQMLIGE